MNSTNNPDACQSDKPVKFISARKITNFFQKAPQEIILHIMSMTTSKDHARLAQVNKMFNLFANDPSLGLDKYKLLAKELTEEEMQQLPVHELYKLDNNKINIFIGYLRSLREMRPANEDENSICFAPSRTDSFFDFIKDLTHWDVSLGQFAKLDVNKQSLLAEYKRIVFLLLDKGIKFNTFEIITFEDLKYFFVWLTGSVNLLLALYENNRDVMQMINQFFDSKTSIPPEQPSLSQFTLN